MSPSNELPNHSKNTIFIPRQFQPPNSYVFQKRKIGKRNRWFHTSWCDDFLWLHDGSEKDAAIYYICISNNKLKKCNRFSNNMDPAFVEKGFKNWKKFNKRSQATRHSSTIAIATMSSY